MPLTALDIFLAAWMLLALSAPPAFYWLAQRWLTTRKRFQVLLADWPALSIIKPIRGATPELLTNLASTLQTGYLGPIELLCCIETEDDPAAPVIRELIAQHSTADIRLLISHGAGSVFGKHANLIAGYRASTHDIVVCSDADVFLPPGILTELIPPLFAAGIGGSTAAFFQSDGPAAGSRLMAIFVAAFGYAPNLAARQLRMLPNAIGGLMAYRKETLRALGDFPAIIADKISDDGALGVAVRSTGQELYLCGQPFCCIRQETSVAAVFHNCHRWMVMYKAFDLGAYFQMLAVSAFFPLGLWVLAIALGIAQLPWSIFGLLVLGTLCWQALWGALTVRRFHPDPQPAGIVGWGRPCAELLFVLSWCLALFTTRTSWGGRQYYVPLGGRARLLGVDPVTPRSME